VGQHPSHGCALINGAALAALFAGAVAIGVTVAIERWGGRTGGLLGTLPSTVVPASLGVYSEAESVSAFRDAMWAIPAGMLLSGLFLWLWRVLPPRLPAAGLRARLTGMILLSLSAWAAAATLAVLAMARVSNLLVVGIGLTIATASVGILVARRRVPAPRGTRKVGVATLLARGVLAATAIGGAVTLAALGGPLAAGVAACFPAIFLTTMVSLWLSQGEAVQTGAVGPMMLGTASVSTYALLVSWTLPSLGFAIGVPLAWLLAAGLVTVPAWWWLARRA
jgi:hypothetical protein